MSRWRMAIVLVGAALVFSDCLGGFNDKSSVTSPSGGGGGGGNGNPPTFTADTMSYFAGIHPAPVTVNGVTYVYVNTSADGTFVQAASNGVSFAPVTASFPAGISRTIVNTSDGRFRMYYLDSAVVNALSAVSNDGLNWTVESGVRFSESGMGGIRAIVLPTGGVRLYFPNTAGVVRSAISSDGLTFTAEGTTLAAPTDGSTWGASAAAFVNGQFHLILTKAPASGITELWHAVSSDGRNWTLDKSAMAANPGVSLNQPAWSINGGLMRVYFRVQLSGQSQISSGIITF